MALFYNRWINPRLLPSIAERRGERLENLQIRQTAFSTEKIRELMKDPSVVCVDTDRDLTTYVVALDRLPEA